MGGNGYDFILMIPILLLSIVLHEFAHAYSAKLAGDMTATRMGRLTLNPLPHIDLFGTIIFPVIAYIYRLPLIGFAKPVPVDPTQFRRPWWDIIVSLSGPFSNFSLAFISTFLLKIESIVSPGPSGILEMILLYSIMINVVLGLFNLIPIPPLDGSHVLRYFLVRRYPQTERYFTALEYMGFFLLTLILVFPPTRSVLGLIYTNIIYLLFQIFGLR